MSHYLIAEQLKITQRSLDAAGIIMPSFANVGRALAAELNEPPVEIEEPQESEEESKFYDHNNFYHQISFVFPYFLLISLIYIRTSQILGRESEKSNQVPSICSNIPSQKQIPRTKSVIQRSSTIHNPSPSTE